MTYQRKKTTLGLLSLTAGVFFIAAAVTTGPPLLVVVGFALIGVAACAAIPEGRLM